MASRRFAPSTVLVALGVVAATLLGLALVGCGGKEEKLFVDPNAPVVKVSEREWQISPDPTAIKAGKVTFTVKNDGTKEHEFVLVKTDTSADQLPVKDGKVVEDDAGTSPGEIEDIAKGKTKSETFDLAPGRYVFICNIEGHYLEGMRAAFTVQ